MADTGYRGTSLIRNMSRWSQVEASYAPLSGRYVGDQDFVRNAIEGVANQTGKKKE